MFAANDAASSCAQDARSGISGQFYRFHYEEGGQDLGGGADSAVSINTATISNAKARGGRVYEEDKNEEE